MYLADKADHEWLSYINLDKVNLGSGKRAIVSDGVYVFEYQVIIPKGLNKEYVVIKETEKMGQLYMTDGNQQEHLYRLQRFLFAHGGVNND